MLDMQNPDAGTFDGKYMKEAEPVLLIQPHTEEGEMKLEKAEEQGQFTSKRKKGRKKPPAAGGLVATV